MAKVATGGTFAVIHVGHRALFAKCVELGLPITVGVTSQPLTPRYHLVPPYDRRKRSVERYFLNEFKVEVNVVELLDHAGPVAYDPDYTHLVTSEENVPYACSVSQERERNGLPTLEIVVVPNVNAYDGRPVSTTRIFNGEIDVTGEPTSSREAV
ncbi:MAG: pantetheine-phosphate adenylyltransferase [Thermoprotei archaeon]